MTDLQIQRRRGLIEVHFDNRPPTMFHARNCWCVAVWYGGIILLLAASVVVSLCYGRPL